MFSHRVLPPLSSLSLPPISHRPSSGATGLLQHKIMTSNELQHCSPVDQDNEHTIYTSKPDGHCQSSASDESPSNRVLSPVSEDQARRSKRIPLPLSDSVRSSNAPIPASKICLCQPDPKVPRPRNGTWLIFVNPIQPYCISHHGTLPLKIQADL